MSARKKRALRRELSDLVLRLAMACGAMLGLLWAMGRPDPAPPASCSTRRGASDAIGECVGDSILATALPYVFAMGGGMIGCGLVAALLLRSLLPRARSLRRPG